MCISVAMFISRGFVLYGVKRLRYKKRLLVGCTALPHVNTRFSFWIIATFFCFAAPSGCCYVPPFPATSPKLAESCGYRYTHLIQIWHVPAEDRDKWHTLVSAVMNLRVPWNAGNFLSSCKPGSCSGRTLHHGASKFGMCRATCGALVKRQ